jgi:cytoskeletal protein CcmA (bactofilin family)
MFNRKSDQGYVPPSSATGDPEPRAASSPSISLTSTLGSTSASGSGASRSKPSNSIIDEWLVMRGDLESEGDILVKGKIIGNVACKLLIVDVDAMIEGGIVAEEVVIRGKTKGTVQATKVRLEKTAVVDSEICHQTFSAEEGARIRGALRYKDDPLAEGEKTSGGLKGAA